jgi:Flp pilus assembly protein TadG
MRNRPHRRRLTGQRRGATLVLVALMLSALLGICAIAVDLSRLTVGINELQTAVDAAALRGALALQRSPSADPTTTITTFLSSSNPVMGSFVTSGINVQGWHWESDAAKRKTVQWGATGATDGVNAVEVTATYTASLMFGRAVGRLTSSPTRRALAWVASMGLTCVRPWMFEVTPVFARAGVVVSRNIPPTESQIASLRNTALSTGVSLMLAPPTVNNPPAGLYGSALAGKWVGVDLPSRNFQSAMNTCNATAVTYPVALNNASTQSSQNSQVVQLANSNIEYQNANRPNICPVFNGTDDRCDVTIPVMLGYAPSGTAFATAGAVHTAHLMTTFRLLCFKRDLPGNTNSSCSLAPAGVNWLNVADGTMYGYLDYGLPSFSGQYSLGTGGSTAQRLLLVR